MSFGWSDLYAGNRFWAPLSEAALLEAGEAAGLSGGMTLLETCCGNGAVSIFLAEEFHVYARGLEAIADAVRCARAAARRSPAAARVRFFHGELEPGYGPVDAVCCLRRPTPAVGELVGSSGRVVWGRYVSSHPELRACFPVAEGQPGGIVVWRRQATPLEWERFYTPQERALRRYRRRLGRSGGPSPVAEAAARQIEAFRAHGSRIAYELAVSQRQEGRKKGRARPA